MLNFDSFISFYMEYKSQYIVPVQLLKVYVNTLYYISF